MAREQRGLPGRRHGERGAAAVEMALVTLLLFVLVAGIVDLGRVLFTYIGVQDAAQEGAIYGSYNYDVGAITARAVGSTNYPSLSAANVAVSCDNSVDPNLVQVTVSHAVPLITPVVGQWFGGSMTVSRTFTGTVFLGC